MTAHGATAAVTPTVSFPHCLKLTPGKRTEEGFFVFKEAELGIDPEAGGTPLCPFDCDCCASLLPTALTPGF
jgi:hypothetical protein